MTKQETTIDKLAVRDDLSRAEIMRLAAARKSNAGDEMRINVCGWTISVIRHVHTGGHWSAAAWRANSDCFDGDRAISGNDSEGDCWLKVSAFIGFAVDNPMTGNQ